MNLDDVHARLRAFSDLVDATPDGKEGAETAGRLLEHYEGPMDKVGHRFRGSPKSPMKTDAMPRWVTVEFPRAVVERTGMQGTAVRVSDVLRWTVEEGVEDALLGEYYGILAHDLDASDVPRPNVLSQTLICEEKMSELIGIIAYISARPERWGKQPMQDVLSCAASVLRDLEVGTPYRWSGIDYPVDFGPPNLRSGMMWDTGWMLKLAAERASYFSDEERSQVAIAAWFYPDNELAIEVDAVDNGAPIFLTDLNGVNGIDEGDMGSAVGSVHVDNYGANSRFSRDPQELAFKLFMPAEGTGDEHDGLCILVSSVIAYTAHIDCDE